MTLRSSEVIADLGIDEGEVWPQIGSSLEIAAANADDAVAGMARMISDGAARVARTRRRRWFSRRTKGKNDSPAKPAEAAKGKPADS